jgi:hypothetical protein
MGITHHMGSAGMVTVSDLPTRGMPVQNSKHINGSRYEGKYKGINEGRVERNEGVNREMGKSHMSLSLTNGM